jgi:NADPH:quinone reductase-like Zn-dependent oxidoreductase
MKAVALVEHGGPEKLVYRTDFPDPVIAPDEVLVKVGATSVNRVDLVARVGYPGLSLSLPHILGGDIAGTVAGTGSGVKGFSQGDRVVAWPLIACGTCPLCREGKENLCLNWKYFGLHRHGGYAEYVAVPAASLLPLPPSVSFEEATALGVAGLTAYHALTSVGELRRGETFMIWGGSGGVGTIAVQLAKQMGATVITTVGREEKKEALRQLGADHVFNHNRDDVAAEVRKIAPVGVDLILDYVGPATFQKSFDLLKKGGRMLLCGILTGRETNFSIHQTYLRHLSVKGLYLGTKEEMKNLIALTAAGEIKPLISATLPLAEASRAHEMMAKGEQLGKLVLKPQ